MPRTLSVLVAALAALAAAGTATAAGYHGSLRVTFHYVSGASLAPSSPADVDETAHILFTVKNGEVVHMHALVDFGWKEIFSGCPNFTVQTSGGGIVDAGTTFAPPSFSPSWTSNSRYVTGAPASFPGPMTEKIITPDDNCNSVTRIDHPMFDLRYFTGVHGNAPRNAKHVAGSFARTLQGFDNCHPFDPTPPPPPVNVRCSWRYSWSLTR